MAVPVRCRWMIAGLCLWDTAEDPGLVHKRRPERTGVRSGDAGRVCGAEMRRAAASTWTAHPRGVPRLCGCGMTGLPRRTILAIPRRSYAHTQTLQSLPELKQRLLGRVGGDVVLAHPLAVPYGPHRVVLRGHVTGVGEPQAAIRALHPLGHQRNDHPEGVRVGALR